MGRPTITSRCSGTASPEPGKRHQRVDVQGGQRPQAWQVWWPSAKEQPVPACILLPPMCVRRERVSNSSVDGRFRCHPRLGENALIQSWPGRSGAEDECELVAFGYKYN